MLRIALLILLLANAGYFAWSQGALPSLGWAPQQHSEPERLQQQLHPDARQRRVDGGEVSFHQQVHIDLAYPAFAVSIGYVKIVGDHVAGGNAQIEFARAALVNAQREALG